MVTILVSDVAVPASTRNQSELRLKHLVPFARLRNILGAAKFNGLNVLRKTSNVEDKRETNSLRMSVPPHRLFEGLNQQLRFVTARSFQLFMRVTRKREFVYC